ncbi:TPA: PrgH/EprH family type III secretion apparatus protein [Yersinia enterocolitica]|nr:PrgH/EprH family type III secretion apparatus protein [Yersinia enterocolitica]
MDTKDNATVVSKPKVLRILNGILNGCEYVIDSQRLLVVVGSDDSNTHSLEPFTELPDDTLFIPQNEDGVNFEIILSQDELTQVKLRELGGNESTVRNIPLNSRVQVGSVIFALRDADEEWEPDVLGYPIEKPTNEGKSQFTGVKWHKVYFIIALSCLLIISSTYYLLSNNMDDHVNKIRKSLENNHELRVAQGTDKIIYVLAEDQRKAIWINKEIVRGHYAGVVRVIYPEKEVERVYSWLSDYMPKLKYFRLQMDNPLIPRLLISRERSQLTVDKITEIRTQLMNVMPYTKNVEVIEINDSDLINQAEEELDALSLKYKRSKASDYVSYTVEGEFNDSELLRLQHFVDNFYHQWGREFIRFNISLENNYLKDKSFSYGDYNYVKSGPGQWLFKSEEKRTNL